MLPKSLKEKLILELNQFESWMREEGCSDVVVAQGLSITSSIKNYLKSDDYYQEHWSEFCRYTKALDDIRQQNILDVCPQFEGYLV